jgi:hypothetical protein
MLKILNVFYNPANSESKTASVTLFIVSAIVISAVTVTVWL